jgi:hypothetical protein
MARFPFMLAIVLAEIASSCASRSLPAEIAPSAPSSVQAKDAPIVPVTRSLEQDPPFGATTTSTSTPRHHHGGHEHGG